MKLDVGRADNVDNDQLRAHVWRGGMRAGVETSIGEIEFRQPVRRRRMSPCLHATGYGLPCLLAFGSTLTVLAVGRPRLRPLPLPQHLPCLPRARLWRGAPRSAPRRLIPD